MKQGILSNIWLAEIVDGLLHFNLPSTIAANQMLLSIPCFMFVAPHLAIMEHC
jgi:hypothetical protein